MTTKIGVAAIIFMILTTYVRAAELPSTRTFMKAMEPGVECHEETPGIICSSTIKDGIIKISVFGRDWDSPSLALYVECSSADVYGECANYFADVLTTGTTVAHHKAIKALIDAAPAYQRTTVGTMYMEKLEKSYLLSVKPGGPDCSLWVCP